MPHNISHLSFLHNKKNGTSVTRSEIAFVYEIDATRFYPQYFKQHKNGRCCKLQVLTKGPNLTILL